MRIARECKVCGKEESNPITISWPDASLIDGAAAEYYNNYTCELCQK